ncbi:MAG: hypothetical protein IKF49_07705 [Clostridia bacterium]|nr:hypothetical protein [Clostridia bacterium]
MFGKKAKQIKEQAALIAQMEAKIEELTHQNERLTEKVDEYTAKEIMIARTLTDANVQAEKLVSEAQREAGNLLEESQLNAELARKDAENLVDDAYKNARDIVKSAEAESAKKLEDTREQINSYVGLLNQYDAMVQENIQRAQESAKAFAKLSEELHAAIPQILTAEGNLIGAAKAEPEENPAVEESEDNLPDAEPAPEEKIWTVSEVASDEGGEVSHVDAIIDQILGASGVEV